MTSVFESLSDCVKWMPVVLAFFVCFAIYVYTQWFGSPRGPIGMPYFGYYPYLKENFHLQLMELTQKYGEAFCFRVTGQLYVHLSSLRAVREAHVTKSDCFSQKSMNYTNMKDMFYDGIFFMNGEPWIVLKKFFVQSLRELGMGKVVQENAIVTRARNIVDILKDSDGKPVDALELFSDSCSMVIRQLLFGEGNLDDQDCSTLCSAYKKIAYFFKGSSLLLAGPVAQNFIIPRIAGFRESVDGKATMMNILRKVIQRHEVTFDKNDLRDLVDFYIHERKTLCEKRDPKADIFTEKAHVSTLLQLFGDGGMAAGWLVSDTIKELLKRPDVQRRIQSEIDEVVGRDRLPEWGDRKRLPYTIAALYEAQRITDFFPVWPSQECTKETTIQGQRIPRGTITLVNMWAVHHDPELYEEPDKFNPSRYMSTEGKKGKAELPIIFGVGKRACAGESLTNMEIFLFVAAVLQSFDLHPVGEGTTTEVEGEWQILVRATPRAL